jgi:enoyl-CoA hydratase
MKTAIALKQVCPTSIELVCRMIRKAKSMTLKECFIQDFMVIEHMVVSPDFKEGVRCVLKEKGVIPKWSCPELKSLKEY